jgi:hypothetical protein
MKTKAKTKRIVFLFVHSCVALPSVYTGLSSSIHYIIKTKTKTKEDEGWSRRRRGLSFSLTFRVLPCLRFYTGLSSSIHYIIKTKTKEDEKWRRRRRQRRRQWSLSVSFLLLPCLRFDLWLCLLILSLYTFPHPGGSIAQTVHPFSALQHKIRPGKQLEEDETRQDLNPTLTLTLILQDKKRPDQPLRAPSSQNCRRYLANQDRQVHKGTLCGEAQDKIRQNKTTQDKNKTRLRP